MTAGVGWVEQSEIRHPASLTGFAALNPSYASLRATRSRTTRRPGLLDRFAPRNDGQCYLIGAAVFSAGAGGRAGAAPDFCASASGRAGSGGTLSGRVPVVVGSAGAEGFDSAPGVDCSGCVACAIC